MPRHPNYVPHGVTPAVILPFEEDFEIDEVSFRKHLARRGRGGRALCIPPKLPPALLTSSAG